jgi:hypothetical protein
MLRVIARTISVPLPACPSRDGRALTVEGSRLPLARRVGFVPWRFGMPPLAPGFHDSFDVAASGVSGFQAVNLQDATRVAGDHGSVSKSVRNRYTDFGQATDRSFR